jgi:hypothetical protein
MGKHCANCAVNGKKKFLRLIDHVKWVKRQFMPIVVSEGEKTKNELQQVVNDAAKVRTAVGCIQARLKLKQREEDKKMLRVAKASPCMANSPATSSTSTPISLFGSGNGIEAPIEDDFADDFYTTPRALAGMVTCRSGGPVNVHMNWAGFS